MVRVVPNLLAQQLDRAGWLSPSDGRVDVLRAACLRRQGQQEAFLQALKAAEQKDADPAAIQLQIDLAEVKSGSRKDMDESQFMKLMAVDKMVVDGGLRLVLLKAIGKAIVTGEFDPGLLSKTLSAA